MLTKLAIWYLRKTKKSVLIGFEVKSGIYKALNEEHLIYDNVLYVLNPKDEPIDLKGNISS